MTFDEFRDEVVFYATNNRPKDWRYGQAVFNFMINTGRKPTALAVG